MLGHLEIENLRHCITSNKAEDFWKKSEVTNPVHIMRGKEQCRTGSAHRFNISFFQWP